MDAFPIHLKQDFPILQRKINGHPLTYLDNSATTQKPRCVIDAIVNYYEQHNSNVSRGIYTLAEESTKIYEGGREKVAQFLNASDPEEVIFTRGTTESINLVAYSWAKQNLQKGNRIILTEMEHNSNLIPWQVLAKSHQLELDFISFDSEGFLNLDQLSQFLEMGAQLLCMTMISNVLGVLNPVQEIIKMCEKKGVPVLLDAAQAVGRAVVDVQQLNCDFLAFSGHKIYGPTGIGVLYAKKERIQEMEPYQTGGGMVGQVQKDHADWADSIHKFEAGTPPVAEVSGLSAALNYVEKLGVQKIQQHEQELIRYTLNLLTQTPNLQLYGSRNAENKAGIFSFNLEGIHPHDVAQILDEHGIAVRAGHHCAPVLHQCLNIQSSVRMSFGIYNDFSDVDRLIEALREVGSVFS